MKKYRLLLALLFVHLGGLFAQESQSGVFTIDSCIQYAFKNSPYLKAKNKDVLIAGKDLDIIKSKRLPGANASASYLLSNQYDNLNEYSSKYAGIEMLQSIWKNGKLQSLVDGAKVGQQMAGTQFLIEKNNMIFAINQQYFTLLREIQFELLSKKIAERIAMNLESAKERYNVGVARKSDILKAETEYSNAIFKMIQYSTDRKIAERNLLKTMGADLSKNLIVADNLNDTGYLYTTLGLDQFYKMAIENLPELKLADQSINRQSFVIKYEKRANGPELDVYAGYYYLKAPGQFYNWFGSVGMSLNFTIFNGFERKNKIAREVVRNEQYENEKEELFQLIKVELQKSYFELLEAKQQIGNSLKQLDNSSENLKIANEEYQQGISSMLELLDAENADFTANQNYINALWEYQMAKAAIERKAGISKY